MSETAMSESMPDILSGWELTPVQRAFLATEARFSFYVGGIGAGRRREARCGR